MFFSQSKEEDDPEPKVWYKANSIGNVTKGEVKLDMSNNKNLSRIYVNQDHSLVIQNITHSDSSFYFCQPYQVQELETNLNFYLDGTYLYILLCF